MRHTSRRLPDRPLPQFWFDVRPNFGDAMAPAVVQAVTRTTPVHVPSDYRGKILSVGSILHNLAAGDTVWGSGAITADAIEPPPDVTFLAVRGPLTRSVIRADVPEVYGDPALLLPKFYKPALTGVAIKDVGIIPHYVDQPAMPRTADPHLRWIDVRQPWPSVVDEISACDVVVSSSLHGLIVAEAYGIPAVWTKASDEVLGGAFKFDDYYLSTGREPQPPQPWSSGLDRILRRVPDPPEWDPAPLMAAATAIVD